MIAALCVLLAVDFNNQSSLRAIEVCNIVADWCLVAESEIGELSILQQGPESYFSWRHLGTQSFGELHGLC